MLRYKTSIIVLLSTVYSFALAIMTPPADERRVCTIYLLLCSALTTMQHLTCCDDSALVSRLTFAALFILVASLLLTTCLAELMRDAAINLFVLTVATLSYGVIESVVVARVLWQRMPTMQGFIGNYAMGGDESRVIHLPRRRSAAMANRTLRRPVLERDARRIVDVLLITVSEDVSIAIASDDESTRQQEHDDKDDAVLENVPQQAWVQESDASSQNNNDDASEVCVICLNATNTTLRCHHRICADCCEQYVAQLIKTYRERTAMAMPRAIPPERHLPCPVCRTLHVIITPPSPPGINH